MRRQGTEQVRPRKVSPKNPFLIPRLLFQQAATRSAVRCRDMVVDPGCGLEEHAVTGPMQAKRQIHVFEIRFERFRKRTDPEESGAAKEAAGTTGAKHRPRLQIRCAEGLTVASLPGDAAHIIAIAGTINREARSAEHGARSGCALHALRSALRGLREQGAPRLRPSDPGSTPGLARPSRPLLPCRHSIIRGYSSGRLQCRH